MIELEEGLQLNLNNIDVSLLKKFHSLYNSIVSRSPYDSCVYMSIDTYKVGYKSEVCIVSVDFKLNLKNFELTLESLVDSIQRRFSKEINEWLKDRCIMYENEIHEVELMNKVRFAA